MQILPSPTGGTVCDVVYRYRLRAALHIYRSHGSREALLHLHERRNGHGAAETCIEAALAWALIERARLDARLESLPIGHRERCAVNLAYRYELDHAGQSVLLLALHLAEEVGLRSTLDDPACRGYAASVGVLAAAAGHSYVDVLYSLELARSLFSPTGDGSPCEVVRLAPHTVRVLREARGNRANRSATW